MARSITTTTDLSSYVGKTITIDGSDCCWTVVGTTETPLLTNRDVTVSSVDCYVSGMESLSITPKTVTF